MIQDTKPTYNKLKLLILDKVGLKLDSRKYYEVEQTLLKGFNKSSFTQLQDYIKWLQSIPVSNSNWRQLIEVLTINETYFFRNTPQFIALRNEILPSLIKQKRKMNQKRLYIWSAGCSTGEEPYSIAILLTELLKDINSWDIFILGSDINYMSLQKAKTGVYRNWSFRDVPEQIRNNYFSHEDGKYKIQKKIKDMITFRYINLVETSYPSFYSQTIDIDMIFCRNVMIYFTNQQTEQIIERFYETINPGGWLVVGHSEPMTSIHHRFNSVAQNDAIFYQKQEQPIKQEIKPVSSLVRKSGNNIPEQTEEIRFIKKSDVNITYKQEQESIFKSKINKMLKNGNWKRAIDELILRINYEPHEIQWYLKISKIYANQGFNDIAKEWCNKALILDKSYLPSYFMMSVIYQEINQWDNAIKYLKQALYLEPEFLFGRFHLGMIYWKLGKKEKSDKIFNIVKQELQKLSEDDILIYSDELAVGQLNKLLEELKINC